jgi:hypothetical protein
MLPYNNVSPTQSITPSALVVNQILNPNALNRNIESISVSLPLYSINVMNQLAISCTNSKCGSAMSAASSKPQPSATSWLIRSYRNCVDRYNTNMRDVLITADCLGVYTNGLNQPLSALIPNTAILLINALVYSLSPKTWSNNDNINCNTWPSNASCYCSSSLPSLLVSESVSSNQPSSSLSRNTISLIFCNHLSYLPLMQYSGLLPSISSL